MAACFVTNYILFYQAAKSSKRWGKVCPGPTARQIFKGEFQNSDMQRRTLMFQVLKLWIRYPMELEETSFKDKFGTTEDLDSFNAVFLQMGGVTGENCMVKQGTTKKGWVLPIESLPLDLARQICKTVSFCISFANNS